MGDSDYNGWRNYETWRVNLEIASDLLDGRGRVTAEEIKDEIEDLVIEGHENSLAADYALAFLSDVDWYEIAEAHNSDLDDEDDNDDDDEDEQDS